MGNPYKIKRHNHIYRRSAGSVLLRVLLGLGAVLVLFYLGWVLYGPVSAFIAAQQERPPVTVGESNPPPEETSGEAQPAAPEQQPTPESPAEPAAFGWVDGAPVQGAQLAPATLADPNALSAALESLRQQGCNAVVLELKSNDGTVNYQIQYREELDSQYRSPSAYDLGVVSQQIRQAGMTPVAVIHAFRDHLYPQADKSAATLYQGQSYLWLDNSLDQGGKTWMNPFSASAQQYLQKIVDDALAAGIEQIVLDSVQFPEGYSLDLIDYQENASADKLQFLTQYVQQMRDYAAGQGASLTVRLPATALLGGSTAPYFGVPTAMAAQDAVIDLRPQSFGESFSTSLVTIPTPLADLYNTVRTASAAIRTQLPESRITAVIQGTGQSWEQVQQQIAGLAESGIESYLLDGVPAA